MYSQCPDCLTRFRVTADLLRVAHGTVRCGRCGSAFDALARLSDALPSGTTREAASALDTGPHAVVPAKDATGAAEYRFSPDDLEKVFVDERDWQRQFGAATPTSDAGLAEASVAGGEEPELLVDEAERLEDITLEGERIQIEVPPELRDDYEDEAHDPQGPTTDHDPDATDRYAVLANVPESQYPEDEDAALEAAEIAALMEVVKATEAPSRPVEPPPAEAVAHAVRERSPVSAIDARPWRTPIEAAPEPALEDPSEGDEGDAEPPPRWRLAWVLGSLLLVLVLAAQVANHFRQELVRHPQVGPLLAQVYARLGLPLAPNWDPRAFQLRQWGASGAPPSAGRLHVQASVTNRAAFAQPFPLLRMQLEDRFGDAVAIRDFEPREYLKNPAQATRQLAPGASAEADLQIVDPGSDAVGYSLDVCLRESAQVLRCAQGPG